MARALLFLDDQDTIVGSLRSEQRGTAYTTIFDSRLCHAEIEIDNGLELLQQLRPIRFLWAFDDSEGVGFLPYEVDDVLQVKGIVFGVRDDVEADGRFRPQQIDMSKLIPYLVSALKTQAVQIERLTARVEALEQSCSAPS